MRESVREDRPPHSPSSRAGMVGRRATAVLATVAAGIAAVGIWVVAQAAYLEDYCLTRVVTPDVSPPEALGGRPAYWGDPVTIVCELDGHPAVHTTDPGPLVGALLLAAAVCVVAVTSFRRARPPADVTPG